MNVIVKQLSLFFENPGKFAANLMVEKNFATGFAGYLTGSLCLFIWQYLSKGGVTAVEFVFMLAAAFGFNMLMGIIFAAIINLFMDLTGSGGSSSGAFVILGIADFVKTLLIPAAILLHLLSYGAVFGGLIFFFAMLFQLGFTIYLLHHAYRCSVIKAWIAYAMPFMFVILVFFAFIGSAIVGLF